MGLLNQIAVNSLYRFAFILLQFLVTILVSRLVGPEGLGTYSLILANANILLIFTSAGVSSGILFHAAKKDIRPKSLFKIAILSALLQLALIAIMEYIHLQITGSYWIWPNTDQLAGIAGILFFFSLVMTDRYYALYNGNNIFKRYNLQLAVFSFITIILLGYLILQPFRPSLNQVIRLIIAVNVLQMISLAIFFQVGQPAKTDLHRESSGNAKFFTYSMMAYLANSIQFLVFRIDFWILNYFRGEAELGLYALAVKISQTLWIIPALLATIILPHITAVSFDKEVLEKLMRVMNTFNLLAALMMGFLSFIFIPFVFGESFSGSILPLLILIPGIFFVALHTLLAAYFAGKNRVGNNLKTALFSLIIIVILDFLLIPGMGRCGAALASSIAYSLSGIYALKLYADEEKYPMLAILAGRSDLVWLKANAYRLISTNSLK